MYLFADPNSRQSMDEHAKYVNAVYVGVGSVLGFGTSYYIYKVSQPHPDAASPQLTFAFCSSGSLPLCSILRSV